MAQTLSASYPFQSPLLNFLAPSISHKSTFAARSRSHLLFGLPISQRPLTSYHTICRAYSSASSNPASIPDAENSDDSPTLRFTPVVPAPSDPKTPKPSSPFDNLIAETISATPAARRRGSSKRPSSLRDMREAYAAYSAAQGGYPKQGDIAGSMVMPGSASRSSTTVNASNMVSDSLERSLFQKRAVRTIKSRPSLGRTIEIDARVDIARGFQLLRRLAAQNRIKPDQYLQRFYERPGMRRKRQRRERWQARFHENFHRAVEKIKAMRRMGW